MTSCLLCCLSLQTTLPAAPALSLLRQTENGHAANTVEQFTANTSTSSVLDLLLCYGSNHKWAVLWWRLLWVAAKVVFPLSRLLLLPWQTGSGQSVPVTGSYTLICLLLPRRLEGTVQSWSDMTRPPSHEQYLACGWIKVCGNSYFPRRFLYQSWNAPRRWMEVSVWYSEESLWVSSIRGFIAALAVDPVLRVGKWDATQW